MLLYCVTDKVYMTTGLTSCFVLGQLTVCWVEHSLVMPHRVIVTELEFSDL